MTAAKKAFYSLILAGILGAGLGFRSASSSSVSRPNENLTDVLLHPAQPAQLLAASEKELYLREGKQNWQSLFFFQEKSVAIKRLISHPRLAHKVFVLSEEGVMEADLLRKRSQWVFRETNPAGNRLHALALHPSDPQKIYVGSDQGLFVSRDGGRNWLRPFRWPETERIELVAFLPSLPPTLLLGTAQELFFSKDGGRSFESGFSLSLFVEEEKEEREIFEEKTSLPRFISAAFSLGNPRRFWIGTVEGVFESPDGGISWAKLPDRGLEDRRIDSLLFSERSGALIAATSRGIAQFHPAEGRWEILPLGLTEPPTALALRTLPEGTEETLFVASGNEIFEWPLRPGEVLTQESAFIPSPERLELFQKLLVLEPTVREVQKAAVRYADVGNGKIKRWHWGSRLRAFVPRLAFGRSFSLGRDSNIDIDRGGTNTADVFIRGPEEIALDRSWDLDLTWELGDFLYSSAQTSIDSRSKLLVELRESILSQVNRIYFERKRVQWELFIFPPEGTFQEKLDLLLRLEELTAQLDSLTNGFLSERIEKIYRSEPELAALWERALEDLTF